MPFTDQRWNAATGYGLEVFGTERADTAALAAESRAAGLPVGMQISGDVGRLLKILASLTAGRLAIEVGTLGGYSALWILAGLRQDGRLITIEKDERHADFAADQFAAVGVTDRIDLRRGAAVEVLTELVDQLEPGSVDLVFIDAAKSEYPTYFELARELIAPAGLLVADNIYGTGASWIDDLDSGSGMRETDAFNRMVAADPDFEAVGVPMRAGILIARRND